MKDTEPSSPRIGRRRTGSGPESRFKGDGKAIYKVTRDAGVVNAAAAEVPKEGSSGGRVPAGKTAVRLPGRKRSRSVTRCQALRRWRASFRPYGRAKERLYTPGKREESG